MKLPTGIRQRGNSLEIYFNWLGKRHFIKLATTDINQAKQIRQQIIFKRDTKTLTQEYLESIKSVTPNTFENLAKRYIEYSDAKYNTKKNYATVLDYYWISSFGNTPIESITYEMLIKTIHSHNFKTNKTLNNCLIPLRGVFKLAKNLDYISINPMDKISNRKVQLDLPDPFTKEEMQLILDSLNELTGLNRIYYWYYELAFWTGLRPSEMIALHWQDVDWHNKSLYIHRSRVIGRDSQVTKTHIARQVLLNDRAYKAIEALKVFNLDKQYVLICPNTNQPFYSEKAPRRRFSIALKKSNIRNRPAYNTRHTYATMLLMDGVNPVFVANQLGHSLVTLMKRYGRWINSDKDKLELSKLNTVT